MNWLDRFSKLNWDAIYLIVGVIALFTFPFVIIPPFVESLALKIFGSIVFVLFFFLASSLIWGYMYAISFRRDSSVKRDVRKILFIFIVFPATILFSFFIIGVDFPSKVVGFKGTVELMKRLVEVKRSLILFLFYPFQVMLIYLGFYFIWGVVVVKFERLRKKIIRELALFSYFSTLGILGLFFFVEKCFSKILGRTEMDVIIYFLIFVAFLINVLGWGYLFRLTFRDVEEIRRREDEYRVLHIIVVWFIQSISSLLASAIYLNNEKIIWMIKCFDSGEIRIDYLDMVFIFFAVFFFFWFVVAFEWMRQLIPFSEEKEYRDYFKKTPKKKRNFIVLSFITNLFFLVGGIEFSFLFLALLAFVINFFERYGD